MADHTPADIRRHYRTTTKDDALTDLIDVAESDIAQWLATWALEDEETGETVIPEIDAARYLRAVVALVKIDDANSALSSSTIGGWTETPKDYTEARDKALRAMYPPPRFWFA